MHFPLLPATLCWQLIHTTRINILFSFIILLNTWWKDHLAKFCHVDVLGIVVEKCKKKNKQNKTLYKLHKLTADATWPFNVWNWGEDWLLSSAVKFCRNLNPNLILGSGGVATVVAGAPIVVTLGGLEVPFTGGELVLPTKVFKKSSQMNKLHLVPVLLKWHIL